MAILDPSRRRVGPGRKAAAVALLAAGVALVALAMPRAGIRAAGTEAPRPGPIADDRPAAEPAGRMTVTGPFAVGVTMVVTPGPLAGSAEARAGALAAEEDLLGRIDPVNHGNGWTADAQGRIAWPTLIPGATYRIIAGAGPPGRREFVVGPGEVVELGDIRVARPRGRN